MGEYFLFLEENEDIEIYNIRNVTSDMKVETTWKYNNILNCYTSEIHYLTNFMIHKHLKDFFAEREIEFLLTEKISYENY